MIKKIVLLLFLSSICWAEDTVSFTLKVTTTTANTILINFQKYIPKNQGESDKLYMQRVLFSYIKGVICEIRRKDNMKKAHDDTNVSDIIEEQ